MRSVISRLRATMRASIRLDTFAQTTRMTKPTAAIPMEARRRDADDRYRDVVYAHDAADRRARSREAALPVVVGEDGDGILAWRLVFRRGKGAAAVRRHAEQGKEIARHESCVW